MLTESYEIECGDQSKLSAHLESSDYQKSEARIKMKEF